MRRALVLPLVALLGCPTSAAAQPAIEIPAPPPPVVIHTLALQDAAATGTVTLRRVTMHRAMLIDQSSQLARYQTQQEIARRQARGQPLYDVSTEYQAEGVTQVSAAGGQWTFGYTRAVP
jgi:hypothetical protein